MQYNKQVAVQFVCNTAGDGHWSNKAKPVHCNAVAVYYDDYDEDDSYSALVNVHFTAASWNVQRDGLVYSDTQFAE